MYECGKDDDHVWLGGRNAEQIRRQNVDCPCFLDFGLLSSDAVDSLRGRYPISCLYIGRSPTLVTLALRDLLRV
jgi:hypothetical protein